MNHVNDTTNQDNVNHHDEEKDVAYAIVVALFSFLLWVALT